MNRIVESDPFRPEFLAGIENFVHDNRYDDGQRDDAEVIGFFDVMGCRILVRICQEPYRQSVTFRNIGQVDDEGNPSPDVRYKERTVHENNIWDLIVAGDAKMVDAVKNIVIPPSQDEIARRREFIQGIKDGYRKTLEGFPTEFIEVFIGLMANRKQFGGYGKAHWGYKAAESLKALGPNIVNMDDVTFARLEDLVLAKGIFGGYRRIPNMSIHRRAVDAARHMRVSELSTIINKLMEVHEQDGTVAYSLEILYHSLHGYRNPAPKREKKPFQKKERAAQQQAPASATTSTENGLGSIGDVLGDKLDDQLPGNESES